MNEKTQKDNWERARLIPISRRGNSADNEQRATSALLAVLSSVEEFGVAFTKPYGAPKGEIHAFTEVSFKHQSGKDVRPDGLIRVSRGSRIWTALIEVKTGDDKLNPTQLEHYLDIAKDENFDALITISNQISMIPNDHPTKVDRRKLTGKVSLHHISWSRILTEAVLAKSHRGVEDPDQAWILGELIRYLEHPNTGTFDFRDMGENWVAVRDSIKNGTLRQSDDASTEVAGRWEELLTFAALHLSRKLGDNVQEVLSAKEKADIAVRIQNIVDGMVRERRLYGKIRIPNTVDDLTIMVNLESQKIEASVTIGTPAEGRQRTRVNWLLRQLKNTKVSIRVDSWGVRSRESLSEMIEKVRENPDILIPPDNRDISKFTLTLTRKMGLDRKFGKKKSFIDSVIATIDDFYGNVVENLQEWQPPAPKLKKEPLKKPEPSVTRDTQLGTDVPTKSGLSEGHGVLRPETPTEAQEENSETAS